MAERSPSPDPEIVINHGLRNGLGQGDQAEIGDLERTIMDRGQDKGHNDERRREDGSDGDMPFTPPRRSRSFIRPHLFDYGHRDNRHPRRRSDSESDLGRFMNPGANYQQSEVIYIKPECFDGKDDWEEYISHFENCAELGRWHERIKLLYLSASLKGQARTFYMSLPAEDKGTYTALVYSLGQRFGSTKHQNRWLSRLEMRKRLPGESIANVGDDIRQMAQKAYRDLDEKAQEALALNQLYKIISIEMKCRCIDKNCNSVAEAVEVIERYESIMGDGDKKKVNVRSVDSKDNKQKGQNIDVPSGTNQSDQHTVEGMLQTILTRIEKLEGNKRQNKGQGQGQGYGGYYRPRYDQSGCFNCGSLEHFIRDCPYRQRPGQDRLGNKRDRDTSKSQGNGRPLTH